MLDLTESVRNPSGENREFPCPPGYAKNARYSAVRHAFGHKLPFSTDSPKLACVFDIFAEFSTEFGNFYANNRKFSNETNPRQQNGRQRCPCIADTIGAQ
eukprot:3120051-Rhodomonas_salina.2